MYDRSQEPLLFPSSDTNSGIYSFELLKILQRWFRCNGWPTAQNIVRVPDSFRAGLSKKPLDEGQDSMPQQDAIKRENKTIYEMIAHLAGRPLPAIPVGAPVPVELKERAFQFHWQHKVLLKFLEVEHGCVAHIRPDHLLDVDEFRSWHEQLAKEHDTEEQHGFVTKRSVSVEVPPRIPLELFGMVSRKAWLDCLLQLLKVCVINRITPKAFKNSPVPYSTTADASFPDVKSDPLTSNVYNVGERILLTWLNYCFANYKERIWSESERGGVPAARWIVNFDVDLTDSLALAAAIGAYCPFVVSVIFDFHFNFLWNRLKNSCFALDLCQVHQSSLEYIRAIL